MNDREAHDEADREPDYRFTLANERTFLAWLRTSLALLAGGAAVIHLLPDLGPVLARSVLGFGLAIASLAVAVSGYRYFRRADEAIRKNRPLPRHRMPLLLTVVVASAVVAVMTLAVVT